MSTPNTSVMNVDFSSVHNHYERPVFEAVLLRASDYPYLDAEALPDVACVALNRMGSRYIRNAVDLTFNMTAKQRTAMEKNLHDAVTFAFELVQTRIAMRARR
ncbi:MAG: late competence development ComFB family protein [Gammaproteobacteria bacterium]